MSNTTISPASQASPYAPSGRVLAITATIGTVIAYTPMLAEYFSNLWNRPYYQHFPFVLGAVGWLFANRIGAARRRDLTNAEGWHKGISLALAATAWLTLFAAYRAESPWLAYISFLLLIGSILAAASRFWQIDGGWAVWALLWLIVRPPMNRDQALVTYLQRLSSQASSYILDALGVLHVMEGNVLALLDKQFFVDEACSGIISVISLLACAAIYGVWRRRPTLHVTVLMAAGICWATVMNTLRIAIIAVVYYWWHVDWSVGMPHEVLSMVVFAVSFLALLSTDVVLFGILAPISEAWQVKSSEPIKFGAALVRIWDRLLGPRLERNNSPTANDLPADFSIRRFLLPSMPFIAFVLLAGLQFVVRQQSKMQSPVTAAEVQHAMKQALACNSDTLANHVGPLARTSFLAHERTQDDPMGAFSKTYEFQDEADVRYLVSFDFPYPGEWHELTYCYQGIGWGIDSRRVDSDVFESESWQHVEADISRPEGSAAFLMASAFDECGRPISLHSATLLGDAWWIFTGDRQEHSVGASFQVQVLVLGNGPIDARVRTNAKHLLAESRSRFRASIVGASAPE